MMGSAYETEKDRRRAPQKTDTLLGFLIYMKKEVLEQREELQILYEDIQKGVVKDYIPVLRHSKPKRSRFEDFPSDMGSHYIIDSTDESDSDEYDRQRKRHRS